MNGTSPREPEDPEDMDFHHFLHRPIELTEGTFMTYLCPYSHHPNCVILAGREYDPSNDRDDGVFYHASGGHIKRNVTSDRINWELAPSEATLSKVHGEDGTGVHFKVRARMD